MKSKLINEDNSFFCFDIAEYESDSDFIKFASTDIYINGILQKQFFVPFKEHNEIIKQLKEYKVHKKLNKYFLWSFIFLDWISDELNELFEFSNSYKNPYLEISKFINLLNQIKQNQSTLIAVKYQYKLSTKEKKILPITSDNLLNFIKHETLKFIDSEVLNNQSESLKKNETDKTNLKNIKELLIMNTVLDLEKLLNNSENIYSDAPLEIQQVNYLIGKTMLLAGIFKSTVSDSEASLNDLVRKRIERFNERKQILTSK